MTNYFLKYCCDLLKQALQSGAITHDFKCNVMLDGARITHCPWCREKFRFEVNHG